ncbi:DnaJ domain-containing protein [Reichenbachiella ulvae]|uniref:DnaJ domain-containing protein n=1 Tax=Reichenbachiella ulvae TaxID=2980104 RepID=A0ABT3D075_9BACT|nr:DnaJ domain-containing protein [Reichenbachiella ulvae]MCV9389198.1 DnaJ domain-containing protein [Reichenbachiella ulvae]
MHNHYLDVLELHEGASKAEVKKAYRRLSKVYHPDLNKSEDAQQRFIEITEAYKFLMDVGPRPQTIHQSEPDYGYDPDVEAYRQWREKAKAYARQKQRDAIRRQNELIKNLLRFFNYATFVMLGFNILLELDRYLPMDEAPYEEFEYHRNRGYHDYVEFAEFEMKFDQGLIKEFDVGQPVVVSSTPIFATPVYLHYTQKSGKKHTAYDRYSLAGFFSFMMKLVFLGVLLYFITRNLDTQLSLAIVLMFIYWFELILF